MRASSGEEDSGTHPAQSFAPPMAAFLPPPTTKVVPAWRAPVSPPHGAPLTRSLLLLPTQRWGALCGGGVLRTVVTVPDLGDRFLQTLVKE